MACSYSLVRYGPRPPRQPTLGHAPKACSMKFDISRDYLDGILLQHPPKSEQQAEIKVGGGLHFLPSSPDGTMHTAVVSFSLQIDGQEQPFARGGWRFLFTTDEAFDPKSAPQDGFVRNLLILGSHKVLTVLNNLCLNANMPLIPVDPQALAQSAAPAGAPPVAE